ncbi:MAG: ATP-grasp domain-containing protein [Actinobacteria bacterium]|nr:ATP-grasp domain-containing protein [Actinomycetota bacterium]
MPTVWILTDDRYLAQRMPGALISWLKAEHVLTHTLVAGVTSIGDDPWESLQPGDVVVARTRHPFGLSLLRRAGRAGVKVLTPWESIAAVRDKVHAARVLANVGVPTPRTLFVASPAALKAVARSCFPLLLKPRFGDNANGIVVVGSPEEIDEIDWTDGMLLAQDYVEAGAIDLKLYCVDGQVWAIRRPSPLAGPNSHGNRAVAFEPFQPNRRLVEIAQKCASAFGLRLFGVDVLEAPTGPVIVDVNDFPNYTGVDDAPEAIGRLILNALGSNQPEAACVS